MIDPSHDSDQLDSDSSGNHSGNDEVNQIEKLRNLILKENKRVYNETSNEQLT